MGSTSIATDENRVAIEEIGYLPFGAVLFRNVSTGVTWESAYKFTGQEHDSEFELYNYNARLYDPVLGRFISPDPFVQSPYNPQSLNRYSYCLNNPLIYTDPSGYWWDENDEWWLDEITVTADQSSVFAYSTFDTLYQDWFTPAPTFGELFTSSNAYTAENGGYGTIYPTLYV